MLVPNQVIFNGGQDIAYVNLVRNLNLKLHVLFQAQILLWRLSHSPDHLWHLHLALPDFQDTDVKLPHVPKVKQIAELLPLSQIQLPQQRRYRQIRIPVHGLRGQICPLHHPRSHREREKMVIVKGDSPLDRVMQGIKRIIQIHPDDPDTVRMPQRNLQVNGLICIKRCCILKYL